MIKNYFLIHLLHNIFERTCFTVETLAKDYIDTFLEEKVKDSKNYVIVIIIV